MSSPVQTTSRPRAPLAELPLHHFVSQSLACSPKSAASPEKLRKTPSRSRSRSPSLSRSHRNSLSVSPHKQAVLQNHRLVREGSVLSPSSSNHSLNSNQLENMADSEIAVLPRRLFGDPPSKSTDSDLSLEASPIATNLAAAESRFSPRNLANLTHHSPSRPMTPKGSQTTPLNLRQHRPPHTSGPKPAQLVEPSPTTQRMSEQRAGGSRQSEREGVLATPSRSRTQSNSPNKALPNALIDLKQQDAASGAMTPVEDPDQSASSALLQSLPKKKHRVSDIEVAIAHEEALAGPIASPSPRKMVDYFSPAATGDASNLGLPRSRSRADSLSDRRQSLATMQSLTDLTSKASVDSLTLTRSGLFLGVVARPLPGWSVYEDPVSTQLGSDDTAPSQDHSQVGLDASPSGSPFSSPMTSPVKHVVPSTPNKENRLPDAAFLASKTVPIALPDRAYSVDAAAMPKTRSSSRLASAAASPVTVASRKRGTGGRLSLLADAHDDEGAKDVSDDYDETMATVLGSGKKVKSASPAQIRKASQQRKLSAAQRKASNNSPQRGLPDSTSMDSVASRTRSRTRA